MPVCELITYEFLVELLSNDYTVYIVIIVSGYRSVSTGHCI